MKANLNLGGQGTKLRRDGLPIPKKNAVFQRLLFQFDEVVDADTPLAPLQ